jgi:hypothetical protein
MDGWMDGWRPFINTNGKAYRIIGSDVYISNNLG